MPWRWRRSQRPAQKRSSRTQVFQLTLISQPHTWHRRMRLKLKQINRHQDLLFAKTILAMPYRQKDREGLRGRARGHPCHQRRKHGGFDFASKASSRIGAFPESGRARKWRCCLMNRHDDVVWLCFSLICKSEAQYTCYLYEVHAGQTGHDLPCHSVYSFAAETENLLLRTSRSHRLTFWNDQICSIILCLSF
jgi:hypothetical protein